MVSPAAISATICDMCTFIPPLHGHGKICGLLLPGHLLVRFQYEKHLRLHTAERQCKAGAHKCLLFVHCADTCCADSSGYLPCVGSDIFRLGMQPASILMGFLLCLEPSIHPLYGNWNLHLPAGILYGKHCVSRSLTALRFQYILLKAA